MEKTDGSSFLLYAVGRGESADVPKRLFIVEYRFFEEVELRILLCRCLRLAAEIMLQTLDLAVLKICL